jgi:tetratricopeptide (TPR) repeat protein
MATQSARATTEARASSGAENTRPSLWQVPTFLAGLLAVAGVYLARPLWLETDARHVARDLAQARKILERPDPQLDQVLELAGDVLERADQFPSRAGEAHFLLGSAYLRRAGATSQADWEKARFHLLQADALGVPEADRPRLAYRLGKVSAHTGADPQRVIDYLAPSIEDGADDPAEGYGMLAQAYLRLPHPNLEAALDANQKQLDQPTLNDDILAPARLLRGELLLRLQQPAEAHKVLKRIHPNGPADVYCRSRRLLAASCQQYEQWDEAAHFWQEVLERCQEPADQKARICYDLGLCYDHLGRQADADQAWKEAALARAGSVSRAAAFRLARLRLHSADPAMALEAFTLGLRDVAGPHDFGANELLGLDEARRLCEKGCQTLTKAGAFEPAQKLAELYQKVALPGAAQTLLGNATDSWARALQEQARQAATPEASGQSEAAARTRFAQAGAAYEATAAACADPSKQPDWLWRSAECYRQGQDHVHTVSVLERFLQLSAPPERLGEGWYRRAEAHQALHEELAAQAAYRHCIEYPGPFAFRARYELALAQIARGDLDEAERALQHNLELMHLAPDGEAHEKTLFAYGGLLARQGNYLNASLRLEEALERYPGSRAATTARRQLSNSYYALAERERQYSQLGHSAPNAQQHHRDQHRIWLEKAAASYQKLEDDLQAQRATRPLTPAEETLLREAAFAVGDCRFDLGTNHYEEAIRIFEVLAGRYHKRVEGLHALARVMNCYWAQQRPEMARATLDRIHTALQEMDDKAFDGPPGTMTRAKWEEWLRDAYRDFKNPSSGEPSTEPRP